MTEVDAQAPLEAPAEPELRSWSWLIVGLVVVALMVIAVAIGWLLRGDDGGSDDLVVVNGAELTERQEEMLRVGEEFYAAVGEGDGDKAASLFVPRGYVETLQARGQLRIDDGSLAQRVSNAPSVELYEPVLVFDDTLVYTMYRTGRDMTEVMQFTPSGDVLIIRTAITW